ncbi:hypothetical protein OEIGOIKO_00098 [Streptomyces chrestomyceticus JCM 4735]|uniref:Secreted protein n=1 Tax=Streptomyces chrestomyceticus JCM 4735 TaxID=1306181 RepID=A0A7U9KN97_9ACTN|nr:hypothetical protein [Streptomyces chrestomyceticus]GCD32385.1 hypothetical protein OEIGOIKO_00098 [Streptomyces chrestomyceticus JCM 4735]
MRISQRLSVIGLAAGALAAGALLLSGVADAADHDQNTGSRPTRTSAPSAEQPSAVEDFSYPGAEKILKEKGLKLKRGDGHILLADCHNSPNLLRFIARDREDFCFRVLGDSGYLELEVPKVGGVQSYGYQAKVNMTVGTDTKTYDIPRNEMRGVGENADPAGRQHTLVEIFATR